jgi:hypothetical protein
MAMRRSLDILAEEIRRIELAWSDETGISYRRKHLLALEERSDEIRRIMARFEADRPNPP